MLTGTDNIPAIYQAKKSYNATGLIGASVPATEHSVMCMGTKDDEVGTFRELLAKYPTGLLSVVSDTWDLWKVLTEYLPQIKKEILSREGKLVIRPDSGDPVDILCGTTRVGKKSDFDEKIGDIIIDSKHYKDNGFTNNHRWEVGHIIDENPKPSKKGVIELLWDEFGGTINEQGYKVLDSHVGAIYGDSITLERAKDICERLKSKGFASTNVVFGIGSFTYQYNTRDTFGFAMKATYGEVNGEGREIFKDPITDDGTKKSKKGLLGVFHPMSTGDKSLYCIDQLSWEQESRGLLQTVFKDGTLVKEVNLEEIRNKVKSQREY